MAQNRPPPPTRPAEDDGYEHRRRTDPTAKVETHRRWYDSAKAQLVIAGTLIGLMVGALGLGYSARDAMVIVRGTPTEFERQRVVNSNIWQTLNRQEEMISEVRRQNSSVIGAIQELCYMQASSAAQRERCRNITEVRR
jgi:hypothetical protein